MKTKLYFVIGFLLLNFFAYSQFGFDVELNNFEQIDETTFEWDIWLKKADGTNDFYLWQMQTRLDFNSALLNTGMFTDAHFTIAEVGPQMNQNSLFFIDEDCTIVTSPLIQFNWAVSNPPNTGHNHTLISDTWLKVARFRAQLRKAGNPHNFASVDPLFAFQASGAQVLVTRSNNFDATYDGSGSTPVPRNITIPSLGVPANDRELASHWFTGTGNWNETVRWNNVTSENANTLPPGTTSNVGIAGSATLTDARTVNELTITEGGYLVVNEAGQLTVETIYNDNQVNGGGKNGAVVIAGWDFEDTDKNDPDGGGYTADEGTNANIDIALFTIGGDGNARFDDWYIVGGGTRAPFGDRFFRNSAYDSWRIQLSTIGFSNLKLSSQQYVDNSSGPLTWKIQWSLDGSNWTDVSGGNITLTDGIWNNLTDLSLPADINNQATVYIQWLYHTGTSQNEAGIDNIIITGDPLPTGLLIQSTAAGTGSLIHNNDGLEATIERYIPSAGYHLVSIPVTQAANPVSGWFMWSWLYDWDVPTQSWNPLGAPTNTPLFVDKGYMIYKYPGPAKWEADTTYTYQGIMNNGNFVCAVSGGENDYNLVPNPYPSAIDWDAANGWTKTNINNSIWIWVGDGQTGQYANYVGAVGETPGIGINGGAKDIPVGQSFFVQANAASPVISMNNDVRVHSTQAFFKNLENVLRIHASGNNYSDEMVIRYLDVATPDFDGQYDAMKMFGLEDAPQIYSMSANNYKLSINSFPEGDEAKEILIGFQSDFSGEVVFDVSGTDSFDSNTTFILVDLLTNISTNLQVTSNYTFTHDPDNDPMRFKLIMGNTTSIDEYDLFNARAYFTEGMLHLHIMENMRQTAIVNIFNASGQVIHSAKVNTGTTIIPLNGLPQGIYMVQIIGNERTIVRKALYN